MMGRKKFVFGNKNGFEKYFKDQDRIPKGKIGILFGHMGVPEDYDFDFYNIYMTHLFKSILPSLIAKMILADKGTVLSDPNNPVARKEFKPNLLMDAKGSIVNKKGVPYVECKYDWVPPKKRDNEHDNGYFLYKGDGKFGAPTIAQKSGCKVVSWYYHSLLKPMMKCPYEYQVKKVYSEIQRELKNRYSNEEVECCLAPFVFKDKLKEKLDELIHKGCETIIYCSMSNPVFSDFEEYNSTFPFIHEAAANRVKIIFADQCGSNQNIQTVRKLMLQDQLSQIPEKASVFVVLSRHGHPFKKETMDWRGAFCRQPLEEHIKDVMSQWNGTWDYCWSNDEFTEGIRYETRQAYQYAIDQGYDFVLEIPTDFLFENTDLMIHHARKKFLPFSFYSQFDPVFYEDWDKPLVRTFTENKTTGVYLSVPVGDRYRPYVVKALMETIMSIIEYKDRHQIGY